jgi:hypothetical protein
MPRPPRTAEQAANTFLLLSILVTVGFVLAVMFGQVQP